MHDPCGKTLIMTWSCDIDLWPTLKVKQNCYLYMGLQLLILPFTCKYIGFPHLVQWNTQEHLTLEALNDQTFPMNLTSYYLVQSWFVQFTKFIMSEVLVLKMENSCLALLCIGLVASPFHWCPVLTLLWPISRSNLDIFNLCHDLVLLHTWRSNLFLAWNGLN